MRASLLAFGLLACRRGGDGVAVRVAEAHEAVFSSFVAFLDDDRVTVEVASRPERGLRRRADVVAVVTDLGCAACYRIERDGEGLIVHAGDVLGAQYGLAAVLEQAGWRFNHPYESLLPAAVDLGSVRPDADTVRPDQAIRGLQPHTLHPIEGLWDLWVPGEENLEGAKRIIDWLVKNRGNQLQYPALDDILGSDAARQDWVEHSRALVDFAHDRGVRVGVGVQLFAGANLQQAFDLVDAPGESAAVSAEMQNRLAVLLDEVPFDLVNLSFGEFSGEDPETFVEHCDLAWEAMQAVSPGIEVSTIVHVGNDPELRVDYGDEEDLLYYFLVKYANPVMVPYVHTVMYYTLHGDAGGAYEHEDFSEHRAFLLDRLARDERVAYFPESAYWVAFDINVPLYLPLYWNSRHADFAGIAADVEAGGLAPLDEHVLFSSGWEWGYWQTDVLTLRQGFQPWDSAAEGWSWLWAPYGEDGEVLAEQIASLAALQEAQLIGKRLGPWLAGRDQLIDLGDALGIHSQPDRPELAEIAAWEAEKAAAFQDSVVDELLVLASGTAEVLERLQAIEADDRWIREVADGVEVDRLRAAFAAAITGGALDLGAGGDGAAAIAEAEALLEQARAVVALRHADLHDPRPQRLRIEAENPTIYDFGYLLRAEELCFWERELAQLRALAGQAATAPGCAL